MHPESKRFRLAILMALLLFAPFGEGGAGAAALLLSQSLIALAWICLVLGRRGADPSGFLPARALVGIGCFLGVAMASGAIAGYPYASFLRILDLALFVAVLCLAGGEIWSAQEKGLMADALLASASLQALIVIIASQRGTLVSSLSGAGLLNPNHEAAYLLLAGLVTLPRLFQGPRGAPLLARAAGLGCVGAAFILLGSRGALLGGFTACLLSITFRARPEGSAGGRGFALLLGGILLVCAAGVAARFGRVEDPFRYQRVQIWQADLSTFAQNPLTGIGPGMFRHVAQRRNFPIAGPVRFGRNFETPHSDLLGTLAETGILGLAAALAAFVEILRRLAAKAGREGGLALGTLLGCAGIAAQGLVEDLSTRPAILTSLGVLLGMALGEKQAPAWQPVLHRTRLRAFLAAGALAFTWYLACVRPFLAWRSDAAMRRATTYAGMEAGFQAALWRNPYQAPTYLYPVTVFLAARPPQSLSLDLYARFRNDLDRGIACNADSADARVALARLEVRAFRDLFQDSPGTERVVEAYRAAIRLAPHDPRIRVELGGFLHAVGRDAESARQMVLALQEEPMYLRARYLLCRLLAAGGDSAAAGREFRRAEAIRSELASYKPDSGYARDISRDPEELRRFLEPQLSGQ
jgi:O-antigen ligase